MSPKTVGLIAHPGKPGVAELVEAVAKEFDKVSIAVSLEKETAALAGRKSDKTVPQLAAETDLLVVLGGDGTILNVAGQLGEEVKPIFGINVGSLGFLTCSSSAAYREAVEAIANGQINFSERTMLQAQVISGGQTGPVSIGLNDVVLSRCKLSRLILLHTRVNGE